MVEASIVVPAYRAERTLGRTVESLLAQELEAAYEVVVVASADAEDELPRLAPDPRLRVITSVPRLGAAAALNRGASGSRGELIAFTDADVVAPPNWLERLIEASRGDRCAAGSVLNGTPRSPAGTAEYLIQFLDLHPRRPARTAWHGATCNLLLPRPLWNRWGPFPEDMDGGEDTLLTLRLREQGRFVFAPDAPVIHLNRTAPTAMLAHQYRFGRFTARLARRGRVKLRPLTSRWQLAPVAVAGRLVSTYARVAAWYAGGRLWAFALMPLVVAGLVSWGVGLMVEGRRLDRDAPSDLARGEP